MLQERIPNEIKTIKEIRGTAFLVTISHRGRVMNASPQAKNETPYRIWLGHNQESISIKRHTGRAARKRTMAKIIFIRSIFSLYEKT